MANSDSLVWEKNPFSDTCWTAPTSDDSEITVKLGEQDYTMRWFLTYHQYHNKVIGTGATMTEAQAKEFAHLVVHEDIDIYPMTFAENLAHSHEKAKATDDERSLANNRWGEDGKRVICLLELLRHRRYYECGATTWQHRAAMTWFKNGPPCRRGLFNWWSY